MNIHKDKALTMMQLLINLGATFEDEEQALVVMEATIKDSYLELSKEIVTAWMVLGEGNYNATDISHWLKNDMLPVINNIRRHT